MIIPKDSGPNASSKVEKETLPIRDLVALVWSQGGKRIPFFKSSRLTVTAPEDMMAKAKGIMQTLRAFRTFKEDPGFNNF